MSKLSPQQKELWKKIQRILWEKWDPIGVYEKDSEWGDEYDTYVPHIFRLAIEGNDHIRIAAQKRAAQYVQVSKVARRYAVLSRGRYGDN